MRQRLNPEVETISWAARAQRRGREARATIYEVITDNPGISRGELCQRSGLSYKQVRRHTALLVQAGFLRSRKVKGNWIYEAITHTTLRAGDRRVG